MRTKPIIIVLAGVNGAGKSSVFGPLLNYYGISTWYNPDRYASKLKERYSETEANSLAWEFGFEKFKSKVKAGQNFAFETTLGGRTYTDELIKATSTHDVNILYCGLESPELYITRVAERVRLGGHAIPEEKIRERWIKSPLNLIRLLPYIHALQVFDNSALSVDQMIEQPQRVLYIRDKKIRFPNVENKEELALTPGWAKPIVMAAIDLYGPIARV